MILSVYAILVLQPSFKKKINMCSSQHINPFSHSGHCIGPTSKISILV